MILELSFLTGRFHATAWGRHVNEAVPEWPPSPFRILRALLDSWYRKQADLPAEVVERALGALSPPPVFCLPRARASHTRSYLAQNSEDPSDRKLVFDGFAIVDLESRVLVGWPGTELDPEALDAVSRLAASLGYLGRSESWVDARVIDDREVSWNCLPLAPGPTEDGREIVSVAGVVPPEAFARRDFVATKGKKSRRLTWLEALGWGSYEAIKHTMNRPPALEPLFYVRASDALDARPAEAARRSTRVVEAVRFAVESKVPVSITEALRVGEQVRRGLMGALRTVLGHDRLTSTFSGKDAEGRPVRGHPHISILPLDDDRDGYIDGLLVTSPKPLTVEEQHAMDRLAPLRRRNGHPLVLTPLRFGMRAELMGRSVEVVSMTPFAPHRHWRWKRDGDQDAWLARQLAAECELRGLPAIVAVSRLPAPESYHRRARWLDFRRARKNDAPQPAYGMRITFTEPVEAPFSIGYGSHFGLGCFVAPPRVGRQ